jgi:Domain of Unknown Function (DUF1206)
MVTRSAGRRAAHARTAGRQAANGKVMAILARAGLGARGVIYALVGIIAIQIALGTSHPPADNSGAVRLIAATPFGSIALWLLVVGFGGLTLWRLSEAIWGANSPGGHKRSQRLVRLIKALFYGFITYGILKYALGLGAPKSSNAESVDLTATAFKYPGGRFAVGVVGVILVAIGVHLAYQAYHAKFMRDMRMGTASPATRKTVTRLGQIGGVARGGVFATVGVFLAVAAVEAKPGKAKGIDSALITLAKTPLGPWLLGLIAVGLVLFGAYSCCEARWRQV